MVQGAEPLGLRTVEEEAVSAAVVSGSAEKTTQGQVLTSQAPQVRGPEEFVRRNVVKEFFASVADVADSGAVTALKARDEESTLVPIELLCLSDLVQGSAKASPLVGSSLFESGRQVIRLNPTT